MNYSYESSLNAALSELLIAQRQVGKEISNYPTPISGCDAQFNQLLSDRSRIVNTINALKLQPFVPTPRVLEPGLHIDNR